MKIYVLNILKFEIYTFVSNQISPIYLFSEEIYINLKLENALMNNIYIYVYKYHTWPGR